MRNNKKIIIIISIVIMIAIVAAFAYLFFMTDIFKSGEELFAKYLLQNKETFEKLTDLQVTKVYDDLGNESKYEVNTKINTVHSEGGEISNPLNNLSIELDIQKDDEQQYVYMDGQILYEDEEYLEAEIIKDQENYGIRFTDVVKQFITVKKDENLETVANDIGLTIEQLETIINFLDAEQLNVSSEQYIEIKDKYLNIITKGIENATFEKQRNTLITYNDVTTETNAYSAYLSSENVETILIEILNNLKTETELFEDLEDFVNQDKITQQIDEMISQINEELDVTAIKIIVYEQNKKNIRTEIEIGSNKIIIENTELNGDVKSKIRYIDSTEEQITQYNCEISKVNTDTQENVEMSLNIINGETDYTITLSNKLEIADNVVTINTTIANIEDITTTSMELENKINIGNDFEKLEVLASGNYISLNDMKEEKRKELINLLKEIVPQKITERCVELMGKFMVNGKNQNAESENTEQGNTEVGEEMSQVEINKFNAKFEFYTGDEVSEENVKQLLDIVKDNISGHLISTYTVEEMEKNTITIDIKKGSTKDESMTAILEKIDNSKKYKVSISYNEENGLIETITISEI